jgi:hypothetical protein
MTRIQQLILMRSRIWNACRDSTPSLSAPGHGLKPLDMEFMKQLHDKVNIIPVIAKADTLTEEEIAYFKAQARHATRQHHKQSFHSTLFKVAWSAMFTT